MKYEDIEASVVTFIKHEVTPDNYDIQDAARRWAEDIVALLDNLGVLSVSG